MADRSHAQFQDGRKPPERVPKSERILNLIAVLLRAENPVPVTEILGKVTGYDDAASRESLMRRFERDKKVLRDIGIPIEHSSPGTFGQEGYFISRKDYFLGELQLPPASSQILRALYAWAHADGGRLSADLRSALVKLGYLIDGEVTEAPLKATEALEPRKGDPKATTDAARTTGANLEVLSEAVLRQRRVRFRYYTLGKDEVAERTVAPYGVGFSSQAWGTGAWYLVGHDASREAQRVCFRVREHLGKTRFEYGNSGDEPFTAKVAFPAPVASEVRSLVRSARSLGQDGDDEVVQFEVADRRQFLRFLLRFVPRVRVVEPADLLGDLKALAREVLARYEGSQ
jgi:predicted DNA-binding transcriptional regulator YafY